MKIIFNPHKKLHKDLIIQIALVKDTFFIKKLMLLDELKAFEQNNLKSDGDGIFDNKVEEIKKHISDLEYSITKLTDFKNQIPK